MRNLTGRQLLLVAAAVLAFAIMVVGVYGLLRGPSDAASAPPQAHLIRVDSVAPADARSSTLQDGALPRTVDPVLYARAVAIALFDWDTAAGFLPTDYAAVVLADADPSGEETPGLIRDVATYLPAVEPWLDLGSMRVTQSLTIEDAGVPDSWAVAVQQAHGQLRPGTTAVTITGTRHRRGVWNGNLATSSSPVSFTAFLACPPAFDRCHLLRLSELNNPLR